jgi:hypothetical protein
MHDDTRLAGHWNRILCICHGSVVASSYLRLRTRIIMPPSPRALVADSFERLNGRRGRDIFERCSVLQRDVLNPPATIVGESGAPHRFRRRLSR